MSYLSWHSKLVPSLGQWNLYYLSTDLLFATKKGRGIFNLTMATCSGHIPTEGSISNVYTPPYKDSLFFDNLPNTNSKHGWFFSWKQSQDSPLPPPVFLTPITDVGLLWPWIRSRTTRHEGSVVSSSSPKRHPWWYRSPEVSKSSEWTFSYYSPCSSP